MKRVIKVLAIFIVVLLFASMASSCGLTRIKDLINGVFETETPIEELPFEERAKKVMENITSKSDEEKSMDVNLKMVFEGMALNGSEFKVDVNGVSNYRYLENGEYQYLQTQTISTILPGENSDVSTHTLGYKGGKMFQTSSDDTLVTRVYSELTAEEFKEHMDKTYGVDDFGLTEEDYQITSCEKIDNKRWVIEFSIFTEFGVDTIQKELLSDIESLVSETHTISEIIFTVIADDEFNMTGYEITAGFEVVDEKYKDRPMPTLEYSVKVEDVFSPKPIDNIDFGKYTKVSDLRAFDTVNKLLNEKIDDEYCELVSNVVSELSINSGYNSRYDKHEISYEGFYKNTENGFEYNFDVSQTDSLDVNVDYKNLTQVTNNGNYSQTKSFKTDHSAKIFVDNLIDPIGISIDGLKEAMLYDGKSDLYKFEFINTGASFGYTSSTLGASIKTDVATLDVVIKNDEIVSISYELIVESNNGITITVTVNCQYE